MNTDCHGKWLVLLLLYFVSANFVHAQVQINEVQSSNNTVIADNFGEYDDWVEIYNSGASAVNLKNYYISDNPLIPTRYKFPFDIQIPANSYTIIWLDGSPSEGANHVDFKLSSAGENIILSNPNGTIIDNIILPSLAADQSFGRINEASNNFYIFNNSTPLQSNASSLPALSPPSINKVSGKYSGTISVTITANDNAQILYTIDGSNPALNGLSYTGALSLNTNTSLRAIAVKSGFENSSANSASYLFNVATNLPILSITIEPDYLWDDTVGMHVVGTNGIPGACSTNPRNWFQDWEYKADFVLIEPDGSIGFQEPAGLSISGGCSRNGTKKSFNVSFKSKFGQEKLDYKLFEDRDEDKYDGFKIRSGGNHRHTTIIDDAFGHQVVKDLLDIDESANRPVTIYLNGEYWGIFNLRDRLNSGYVGTYHPKVEDKDNIDLIYLPLSYGQVRYWLVEKVSKGDKIAYLAFDDFIQNNNLNDVANYNQVKEMIDVNSFMDYTLAQIYYNNGDWPGNNLKVWRDKNNGKFRWMMFDLDFMRSYGGGASNQGLLDLLINNTTNYNIQTDPIASRPFRKLMENDEFKYEFTQRLMTYLELVWNPTRTDVIYDDLANRLTGEIDLNHARWGGWNESTWQANHHLVKGYTAAREAPVKSMFQSVLGVAPSTFSLHLNFNNNTNGQVVLHNSHFKVPNNYIAEYYNSIPIKITAVADPGYQFSHWQETGNTNPSIYQIFSSNTTLTPVFTPLSELVINEIYYNPVGASEDEEFIEIHNPSNFSRNLHFFQFTNGICFQFPEGASIAPNEFIVVAKNAANYQGNGYQVFQWESGSLDNDGEKIALANLAEVTVDSVKYNDASPWSLEADGLGYSLAYLENGSDNNDGNNWKIQIENNLTPGSSNIFCSPITINSFEYNVSCLGANDGFLQVSASGGASPFTFIWSNGIAGPSISGLIAGNYSVTVTDANTCTEITSFSLTQPSLLSISTTKQNQSNYNINNGSATATGGGGTPSYSYNWSNGGNTALVNNLAPGNYTVTITDQNSCTETASVTIDPVVCVVNANASHIDVSFLGANNGSATATGSGGPSPYSYAWSNGDNTANTNNLSPGNYTVTVTAANGCFDTSTLTIDEVDCSNFNLSASHTNLTYLNVNDGTATANPSGVSPYTYAWSNGASTKTITGLAPGIYTVTVTDANGCFDTSTLTIDEVDCNNFNLFTHHTDLSYLNANDGSATANPTGTSPFTYAWSNGASTKTITGLAPGNYTVTVTDAIGCSDSKSVSIANINCASFSVTTTHSDLSFLDANDGTATANPIGVSPYTYAWSNGSSTKTITGLAPGNYTVTVTDAIGCSDSKSVSISNISCASFSVTTTHNDLSYLNANDGTATANPSGTSPYSYAWSNGSFTKTITGLAPGNYTVTATDAVGCSASTLITIDNIDCASFSVSTSHTNLSYLDINDGTATANPSGVSPYTYAWSNNKTTKTINNLAPGNYTVTATDAVGCSETTSVTILNINCANFSVSANSTNVSFVNANDGTATANPTGVSPYAFAWSNGGSSQTISGLAPGSYFVTATDAVGCSGISSVNITDIDCSSLGLSVSKTNETQFGIQDGTATATPTGGQAPYSYTWSNGDTGSAISNLAAGTYTVTLTDNLACTTTKNITIAAGNTGVIFGKLYIDDNNNGSLDAGELGLQNVDMIITQSNGLSLTLTTDVNGEWSAVVVTGLSQVDLVDNDPDLSDYQKNEGSDLELISVTIGNSFDAGLDGFVPICNLLTISSNVNKQVSCYNDNDGSASISAAGGASPYTYNWSNGTTGASQHNLTAGSYTISLTDANNCMLTTNVTITEPNLLSASISKTDESFSNANDGTASVSPTGGTSPYSYNWSNGGTGSSINNLAPGNYSVTITDDKGCSILQSATIIPIDCAGMLVNMNHLDQTYFNTNNGTASATPTGGSTPYTYAWSNGGTGSSINNLAPGVYELTLSDNLACQVIETVTIDPVDCSGISLQVNATDLSAVGANDGTVEAIVVGGQSPYTYAWNNGQINQNLSGLSPATYVVTVTDNIGCQITASAIINNIDCSSLNVTINTTDETIYQSNDGTATAIPAGGVAPFQYDWSTGQTGSSINNLAPGNYALTLTDDNACAIIKNFNILQAQTAYLTGRIYEDVNANNTFDATDQGMNNIDIRLTESNGNTLTVTTDANGIWISLVRPGLSMVEILDSANQLDGGNQTEGNNPTLITAILGNTTQAGDDGFNFFTEVCGRVYYDTNANGILDNNETLLSNIDVIITDQIGAVYTMATDNFGAYCMTIIPGNTSIAIDITDPDFPSGAIITQNTNPQSIAIQTGSNQAFDMGFFRNITLDLTVFLEGALTLGSGDATFGNTMRTELNDIHVLPGQTYIGGLFGDVYFTPGQPYDQLPWNYQGNEGDGFDSGGDTNQGDASYPADVVDWVLLSLRTDLDKNTEVCTAAALLYNDGQVQLTEDFACDHFDNEFYLVVEHRNHLIVMSSNKVAINNGTLTYDFTNTQSYTDFFGLSVGQKQIVNQNGQTKYVMYAGNADQESTISADTDINVNDKIIWEASNNEFPVYSVGDFDLSGDTNVNDKLYWEANNNNFSSVPR